MQAKIHIKIPVPKVLSENSMYKPKWSKKKGGKKGLSLYLSPESRNYKKYILMMLKNRVNFKLLTKISKINSKKHRADMEWNFYLPKSDLLCANGTLKVRDLTNMIKGVEDSICLFFKLDDTIVVKSTSRKIPVDDSRFPKFSGLVELTMNISELVVDEYVHTDASDLIYSCELDVDGVSSKKVGV